MNYWRWLIILISLVCLTLLVGAAWGGWSAGPQLSEMRSEWRESPPFHTWISDTPAERGLAGVGNFFSLFLTGVLLMYSFPLRVRHMQQALTGSAWRMLRLLALGLTATLLVVAAGIASVVSTSTFPLAIFLGGLIFLVSVGGLVVLAYALGSALFKRAGWMDRSPLYALLLGMLLILGLGALPWLGVVVKILAACLGAGLVIATRFGSGQAWDLTSLTEE